MSTNWFSNPAPVTRRLRAYFAPVNRASSTPVFFDPAKLSAFSLDSPPAPWVSLGWVQNFIRKTSSKTGALLTGIPAAPLGQVRESLDAIVSFSFLTWTKLNMALATGSQHMNLLAPTANATPGPDGAQAAPAVTLQPGSTATTIMLSSSDAANFTSGTIVAIDADYTGQTGFVGSPVSGAFLRSAVSDTDYIRRITFNMGMVQAVTSAGLTLAQPLPGGSPGAGAKLQEVVGFVDREGGCFFHEWSALFVMEGSQGERIYFHYPRLQAMTGAQEGIVSIGDSKQGGLARVLLKGEYLALPVVDPLDGERILCYRGYLPAPGALV